MSHCEICKEYFERENSHHCYRSQNITCELCEETFQNNGKLKRHIITHYDKPFECRECEKSFSRPEALRCHKRIHTGEKPFECHLCEKAFKDKSSHGRHTKNPTQERFFTCNFCFRTFIQGTNSTAHIRRKFRCEVCENISSTMLLQLKNIFKWKMATIALDLVHKILLASFVKKHFEIICIWKDIQ